MLYIRTNMNSVIATGHVMRCLSIADAARELGDEVTFILSDNQAVSYITDRGYQTIVLDTKWDDLESELPVISDVIMQNRIDAILVDSYQVTEGYLGELSKLTKVIYLDDLNAFHYPVDAIVCYANYYEKFQYPKRYPDTKLYLGMQYMPLRKEFSCINEKTIKTNVESILLLSGGNDEHHVLAGILDEITIDNYENIIVICGRYYTGYEQLVSQYKERANVRIFQAVSDIERYMQEADLAVSAGGTTLYELCACGTPTISFSLADNQLDNVRKFAEDKVIDYAGDARYDNVVKHVGKFLIEYSENKKLRQERSQRMQELVDGKGAGRIVKAWKELVKEW